MKLFLFLTIFPICMAFAQDFESCGYYGDFPINKVEQLCEDPILTLPEENEAQEFIADIMERIGLSPNFQVSECESVQNAAAINIPSDIGYIRYIYFSKDFYNGLKSIGEEDWGIYSVLAHEIGHHLLGHTLDNRGSRPEVELEADKFSGFMMYMLGSSIEEAYSTVQSHASQEGTITHPGKQERIRVIKEGYQNAKALIELYKKNSRNADYTTFAKKMFQKAYNLKGDDRDVYIKKVAYYGKATEYKADYAEAWRNRAKFLNILKLYKKAKIDANRALSLDSENWNAYSEKAISYLGLKDFEKAIKVFSIPIENSGEERPYDYWGRGVAYERMGNRQKAISDLEKALKLKPDLNKSRMLLNKLK